MSTSLPVELLSDSDAVAWHTSPVETAVSSNTGKSIPNTGKKQVETAVSPVDSSSIPAGATVTLALGRSRRLDRLFVTRSLRRRLFAS